MNSSYQAWWQELFFSHEPSCWPYLFANNQNHSSNDNEKLYKSVKHTSLDMQSLIKVSQLYTLAQEFLNNLLDLDTFTWDV